MPTPTPFADLRPDRQRQRHREALRRLTARADRRPRQPGGSRVPRGRMAALRDELTRRRPG